MNNRIRLDELFKPTPSFGLVGWLEQTRVTLPLKGVECRFRVCGDLLSVELDQIFHVNAPSALDCLYSFPLPSGAAVYRCEMHVNGRVIRARVEERQRALELAREHKVAGHRTALVEVERDNLFTLSLGNLQPGDMVVIRLAYFETLTRLADWTSLRIPFCPGVRYIPGKPLLRQLRGKGTADDTDQVPDASRISPPRIDAMHPEAAYLSVQGVVENPLGSVKDISSASHPVMVVDGEQQFRVTLADRGAVPAVDFALRWSETPVAQMQSAALSFRDGVETYALLLMSAPAVTGPVESVPQDFYFLVDRSGSMAGLKWDQAIKSFRAFLQHLRTGDRAWVSFFDDAWQDFAEKPMTTAEFVVDPGLGALERLGTRGGTELLPALKHALHVIDQHSTSREAQLILITDGQVGNEHEIIEHLRPHSKLRVHTFGIDLAVNDGFLNRLAAQQNGTACLLQPTDDIVGAVARLGSRLRRPVLTSLIAEAGWEFPGSTVPDLYAEDRLSISLRNTTPEAREIVLKGRHPDGREETFRFPLLERDEPALRLLWASRRIRRCLDQGDRAQAIALAQQHNLLCEGASFIAWDDAEQVPVAQREVYQPSIDRLVLGSATLYNKITEFYRIAPASKDPAPSMDAGMMDTLKEFLNLPNTGASANQAPSSPPPAQRRPPYRYQVRYESDPRFTAWRQVNALLDKQPLGNREQFSKEIGDRLGNWYVRFAESFAFPEEIQRGVLISTFMEWVVDGGSDAERRMKCLEELIELLENRAPNPEIGLACALEWLTKAMSSQDGYRNRVEAVLKDVIQELAKVRAAERRRGKRLIPP